VLEHISAFAVWAVVLAAIVDQAHAKPEIAVAMAAVLDELISHNSHADHRKKRVQILDWMDYLSVLHAMLQYE